MSMTNETAKRWLLASKRNPKIFEMSTKTDLDYWKGKKEIKQDENKHYYIEYKNHQTNVVKRRYVNRWADSTIKKFLSINGDNPTCQKLLSNFNDGGWNFYKPQEQFHNWEYLCLLKLVWNSQLQVMIGKDNNGIRRLMFKNPRSIMDVMVNHLS